MLDVGYKARHLLERFFARPSLIRWLSWSAVAVLLASVLISLVGGIIVQSRLREMARSRYDLNINTASTRIAWSGLTMRGVDVADVTGEALRFRTHKLELRANVLALVFRGADGIREIRADGARIFIDTSKSHLRDLLKSSKGSTRTTTSPSERRERRILLSNFDGTIRDSIGPLVKFHLKEAQKSDGTWRAVAPLVAFHGTRGEEVQLQDMRLELRAVADGLGLDRLTVKEAHLAWGPTERSLRDRLINLHHELRMRQTLPSSKNQEPKASWLRALFTSKTDVRFDSVHITTIENGKKTKLLTDGSASLHRAKTSEWLVKGQGQVQRTGKIKWELSVRPDKLRAEGNVKFNKVPLALLVPILPALPWYNPENAFVDADLDLSTRSHESVALEGRVQAANVGLASERIANSPVVLESAAVAGSAVWWPMDKRLELTHAEARNKNVAVAITGTYVQTPDNYFIDVRLSVPPTSCNDLLAAVPRALLGQYTDFSWSGNWGADASLRVDSTQYQNTEFTLKAQNKCRFVAVPQVADMRLFQGPFVHEVTQSDGSEFQFETGPGTMVWAPISEISDFMVHAVLAQEDAGFFRHHGFAVAEIAKALAANLEAKRFLRGASTITMQLVKNLLLHREKTLARKFQEVVLTWWVEEAIAKKNILELYLNVIEFGPTVYGIRQASRHYFGKHPSELSLVESVFLSMVLPNPISYSAIYETGSLSDRWKSKIKTRIEHMYRRGRIDQQALDYALSELQTFRFHALENVPSVRQTQGHAAPLPYQEGFKDEVLRFTHDDL